jgi:LCP family protein required for cell wall assembly
MGLTIPRPVARPYYSPRPPIGRRIFVWLRRLLGLLVLGGIGYLVLFSPSLRDAVVAIARGELSPAVSFPGRSAVTVLVMGRDRDLSNRKQVLDTPGRSDLMMLARWDFDYRTLSVVSIPRDTRVRIPGRGYHKINAAHSMGGPALAARTVEAFVGVRPDRTLVLDFDGFEQVIDAIGGVTLTVDHDMDYDDNWGDLHIHLKKGRQHLNGKQAMGFVRFRKSKKGAGESDLKRVQRQQVLLDAVKQRMKNPLALVRAPLALDALRCHTRSSLSFGQLLCLGLAAARVPPQNQRMTTLPSRIGKSYVYPDPAAAQALVREYFGIAHR